MEPPSRPTASDPLEREPSARTTRTSISGRWRLPLLLCGYGALSGIYSVLGYLQFRSDPTIAFGWWVIGALFAWFLLDGCWRRAR